MHHINFKLIDTKLHITISFWLDGLQGPLRILLCFDAHIPISCTRRSI